MNFFTADVRATDKDNVELAAWGGVLRIQTPVPSAAPTWADRRAIVGIRPEDIELTHEVQADVTAEVDLIEPLGRELLVHVRVRDDAGATQQLRVLTDNETRVSTGTRVGLRLKRQRLHFFDLETEDRLV